MGQPKIADFGLAKDLTDASSRTRTGAVVGTPTYMAPEQASPSAGKVGPMTDVYALGVILYEMLCGRPPFVGDVPSVLADVVATEPLAPRRLNRQTPRDLETICLKCLQKEPRQRYGSAWELAEDLRRYLQGEPIQARPLGMGGRLLRWARRRPALAAVYCLLLLVLGLGGLGSGAVALWRRAEEAHQEAVRERQEAGSSRRQLPVADSWDSAAQWRFGELAAGTAARAQVFGGRALPSRNGTSTPGAARPAHKPPSPTDNPSNLLSFS